MCVYVLAYMCVFVRVRLDTYGMHVCVCICMCVCMCVCVHVGVRIGSPNGGGAFPAFLRWCRFTTVLRSTCMPSMPSVLSQPEATSIFLCLCVFVCVYTYNIIM
jgi:hypothetical protein